MANKRFVGHLLNLIQNIVNFTSLLLYLRLNSKLLLPLYFYYVEWLNVMWLLLLRLVFCQREYSVRDFLLFGLKQYQWPLYQMPLVLELKNGFHKRGEYLSPTGTRKHKPLVLRLTPVSSCLEDLRPYFYFPTYRSVLRRS